MKKKKQKKTFADDLDNVNWQYYIVEMKLYDLEERNKKWGRVNYTTKWVSWDICVIRTNSTYVSGRSPSNEMVNF